MLISGLFGRKNLYSVEMDAEFPEEIFAGRPTPVKVTLVNKSRFAPAFLIRVAVEDRHAFFPFLPAGSSDIRFVDVCFEKRGRCCIDTFIISSVFPFNFFTRFRKVSKSFDLVVFPAPQKCSLAEFNPRRSKFKGSEVSNMAGFDSDILSIRDYLPGDPLKYISWKSTAKTGHLKTKELSSIQHPQVIIDFDKLNIRDLEAKISCVTFAILKLLRSNTPVGLIISGRFYKPAALTTHKLAMLRELALYAQG